jgi:Transcriptional regulator SbtR-like, C-terminal domain
MSLGTLRSDIAPADVLASLSGASLTAGEPAQRDQARRLLDLLMDGLRHQPGITARGWAVIPGVLVSG